MENNKVFIEELDELYKEYCALCSRITIPGWIFRDGHWWGMCTNVNVKTEVEDE